MTDIRFNYRHPVFYSRKHPHYADINSDIKDALVRSLRHDQPPF
jgi:hypothetical protein